MFLDNVPKDGNQGSVGKEILAYTLYLLFWVLLTATGFWLMMESREVILELMIVAQLDPWAVRGYDRWIIFVLGLGWFIALLWTEHYLRTGIERGRLWRNIGYVAATQAVAALIVFAIRFLIS